MASAFRVRISLFAMSLLSVGCGSSSATVVKFAERPHVWDVSVGNLMRSGKDYHGQTVRVKLQPLGYAVSGREVHYPSPIQGSPAAVVFVCRDLPQNDNGGGLEVTGRVTEIVYDRQPRTATVNWQVRVGDCTVLRE